MRGLSPNRRQCCLAGLALLARPAWATPPWRPAAARYLAQSAALPSTTTSWTFVREAQRITLAKGEVLEETWHRDAAGRISLQRCFHQHQRVVNYSAGELVTLGVQPDWAQLGRLVDGPTGLLQVADAAASTSAWGPVQRLQGHVVADRVSLDWLPDWQLPLRLQRQGRLGQGLVLSLQALAGSLPADALPAGARSAHYQHLDAADFGDMAQEPVVRLCQWLDQQQGWRSAHAH